MRKIVFLMAFLLPGFVFAQFSNRTNDSTTYRIGCRPAKGYKAITLSFDPQSLFGGDSTSLYEKTGLTNGSLFYGRYFITDNIAIRGGVRLYKKGAVSSGDVNSTLTGGTISGREMRSMETEFILIPGIEKHFGYNNIFDIYLGADLYTGFGRTIHVDNTDYTTGFHDYERRATPKTVLGLGAVAGINFFVMDLPLSIGLEYGINSMYSLSNRTKVEADVTDATGNSTYTYYTQEKDPFGNVDPNSYSSLKSSGSYISTASNFRMNINFYFR